MKNEVFKRLTGKTPKFFKRLRNIGIILASVSGAIMAAPVALPAAIVTAAGYMLTASTVIAAVAQLPVENIEELKD